jgi:hypothetical protein
VNKGQIWYEGLCRGQLHGAVLRFNVNTGDLDSADLLCISSAKYYGIMTKGVLLVIENMYPAVTRVELSAGD